MFHIFDNGCSDKYTTFPGLAERSIKFFYEKLPFTFRIFR